MRRGLWILDVFAAGFYAITVSGVLRAWRKTGRPPLPMLQRGSWVERLEAVGMALYPAACAASSRWPHARPFRPLGTPRLPAAWVVLASSLVLHGLAVRALGGAFRVGIDPAPGPLVRRGPYRWVRHPIYASFLGYFLGAWLARPSLLTALSLPVGVTGVLAQTLREERVMGSVLGAAYEEYARTTRRFLPGLL
jgi:protein-S-isoprenylcysteine O-methyltransferase Ste14